MPFQTIVGHRRLLALLAGAAAGDRVPQALLLAGPSGVGKRQVALALAQRLNCLAPAGGDAAPDACGACSACDRIARGVHPDVLVLAPGDTWKIRIEQVRDVVERAGYRPFEGRRRVVIIDDADALVEAAQHALLKTLEEPPSASVFALVSSRPDVLLPTVRSRCSRLRFGRLTTGEVAAVLERDHGIAAPDARALAATSGGSVGVALALDAADLTEARAMARALLERTASARDASRRIDVVKRLAGGKKRPLPEERAQWTACLRAAASMLRDISALSAGAAAETLANADLRDELERLSRTLDDDRTVRAFGAVDRALGALERHASPKVVADWLAVQL